MKEEEIEGKSKKNENKKFDNQIEILKIRLKNISNKNKEKQRLLSNYTRNANVIEEAFRVIQQGSGIKNIDEIVTAFTKAEEQNYALWNYVDQLGQECDQLEEMIAHTDKEIAQYEKLQHMNHHQLQSKIQDMRAEAEDLKQQILANEEECNYVQEEFNEMQKVVQTLAVQFKKAKFRPRVSTSQVYDSETQFNESNITHYLAELEEYFSSLITYTAKQRGDQDYIISSVPIEALNEKDFNRKELNIDAPYEADEKRGDDASTVGGETVTGDEIVTDPRSLYNKFQTLLDRNQIDIVYQHKTGGQGMQPTGATQSLKKDNE